MRNSKKVSAKKHPNASCTSNVLPAGLHCETSEIGKENSELIITDATPSSIAKFIREEMVIKND